MNKSPYKKAFNEIKITSYPLGVLIGNKSSS
jgi:hypothetical protein